MPKVIFNATKGMDFKIEARCDASVGSTFQY